MKKDEKTNRVVVKKQNKTKQKTSNLKQSQPENDFYNKRKQKQKNRERNSFCVVFGSLATKEKRRRKKKRRTIEKFFSLRREGKRRNRNREGKGTGEPKISATESCQSSTSRCA